MMPTDMAMERKKPLRSSPEQSDHLHAAIDVAQKGAVDCGKKNWWCRCLVVHLETWNGAESTNGIVRVPTHIFG